ncbi:zinc-ribbon domain-containing protein [Falcatimonas sp. MSJ-15]|uniref:zinc ribbon domain-containing protein n=1 Tax=Falcatimonas sp. MSJ-15 TaxID=2841515 RepID=UPI001C118DF1|nr:zinc ribbon domain-containing protein [Falcatimonas sp. MSJ-15]MBU5471725.1 zinc-ribbon domain-containing protein [Falcatimonas sp. MSJ-15]
MALIKCPECGKEISDTVKSCPHCGYKIKISKTKNSRMRIMYAIIVIILVIGIIVLTAYFVINNKKESIDNYVGQSIQSVVNSEKLDKYDVKEKEKTADTVAAIPTETSVPKTDTVAVIPTETSVPKTDTVAVIPTETSAPKTDTVAVIPTETSAPKTDTVQETVQPTVQETSNSATVGYGFSSNVFCQDECGLNVEFIGVEDPAGKLQTNYIAVKFMVTNNNGSDTTVLMRGFTINDCNFETSGGAANIAAGAKAIVQCTVDKDSLNEYGICSIDKVSGYYWLSVDNSYTSRFTINTR